MKNLFWLLSIGAITILTACSTKTNTSKEKQTFKVTTPLLKDTSYTQNYVAEIHALQHVEIRSRVNGFIESQLVDEGQKVKKGQVLFSINNSQFVQNLQKAKAATQSAEAELRSAEIELEGAQQLLDKNFISQAEYNITQAKVEALKAKLQEAKAEEAQAELHLSFAQVRAPFDGFINRIPLKIGSIVEEGDLLTTISNNQEMFAYFNVSEVDYLKYIASTKEDKRTLSLILADGSRYPHQGVIETVESEFDNNTGTIAFRAKFPNPDNVLKHGATTKVQLEEQVKNAILIPQKVTFEQQEHLCVFVVDKQNRLQIRKVKPSFRLPHLIAIKEGLSPKDKILYEGLQYVKEGDTINTELVSFSQFN
ncbi:efflux transporter periplasmic adaptor subunit [Seonamhaeicola sp. S2-3]|uniref:efflux RND transporter periplasmic adaptor subunit n=1 Tax=Seonamhaeicola sp. S2-3 TaxID=1936081 RepID=UPI0009728D1F|nr:efflux RND transporter periplasmic adaptor subunit [Seonamhaeicola sp. S2-3]APY09783.1 efflux transporter periplasmic adaptor subunit [Seonamhaeicola sp. S2-3]